MSGIPKRIVDRCPWLDSWQFWTVLAFFGLAAVTVALWVNFGRVSRQAAERRTDIVANADSQYTQCVKSIPTLRRIDRFLHGVEEVHGVLLRNSLASHVATPRDTKLYRTQILNIARLRDAFRSVAGVRFPIPTRAKCLALRQRLEAR